MGNVKRAFVLLFALMIAASTAAADTDALPSWNDGPAKSAIIEFVQTATDKTSIKFVPPAERIAVFDNDGTLWASHPIYVQLAFALDRVKALAPQHPEWKNKQPFKAVLEGDLKTVMAGGEHALLEIVMATHVGMTTEEFSQIVLDWLATARHTKTGRLHTDMVYQHIGRRPIAAFGNSDGDIEMLQYTDSGKGVHLEMMVHHDDAKREYVYACDTKIGKLCKGLELAKKRGWQLISMKNDWKTIFAEK